MLAERDGLFSHLTDLDNKGKQNEPFKWKIKCIFSSTFFPTIYKYKSYPSKLRLLTNNVDKNGNDIFDSNVIKLFV